MCLPDDFLSKKNVQNMKVQNVKAQNVKVQIIMILDMKDQTMNKTNSSLLLSTDTKKSRGWEGVHCIITSDQSSQ